MDSENPDKALLAEIETQAIDFAREAGQILLEHSRQPLEVRFKDKNKSDPVTAADHRSEEYLKQAISEKFPGHSILSEEGGVISQSDSPFTWVLDPLDGTANFINNLPLFAVSIGVLWEKQPVVGAIYVPVSHRAGEGVYHACLGNGAFLDAEKIGVAAAPPEHPLAEIPGHFGRFRLSGKSRKQPHEARNLGSIALELALTASGVFQYALFGGPKLWDAAAGVLLVREAGGLVFTRRKGSRNWLPLEQFQPEADNKDRETTENLRGWSAPLIAGAPDIAGRVVRNIRSPAIPLSWLTALRRKRGRKKRGQATEDRETTG